MAEEKHDGGNTITIKKDILWKAGFFLLAILLVISIFTGGFGLNKGKGDTIINNDNDGGNQQQSINAKALIEDNDPVLGNKNADISIIEFSDFQCPFCAKAFEGAITEFKNSAYFKNGQVNLIYKHFPLNSIHPYAQEAAEASLCAQEQRKFWEYHDILFANQEALDTLSLKKYASQLSLNTEQFNSCLDNKKYRSEVSKETAQALSAGGQGTPYFVIVNKKTGNYQTISGAYPWSTFDSAIQSVL